MIYVNYKKEKFWIDAGGKTYPILSSAENKPHAVITDSSTFKKVNDENYRYFSKTQKGYFLENEIINKNSRSLLEVLGLEEGKIVGIYFSNRVLLFTLVKGVIKSRFSPENILDPQNIVLPFAEWEIPEDTPILIYGIQKPLQELIHKIANTNPLKDKEEIRKKITSYQKIIAFFCILFSIASYITTSFWYSHEKKMHTALINEFNILKNNLHEEIKKRLPAYINCLNIPFDKVFYNLSFLEPFKFDAVEINIDKNNIVFKSYISDVKQIYAIKEAAKKNNANFELNLQQGGGNAQIIITKPIKFEKESFFDRNSDFCNNIDRYNSVYSTNVQ